MKNLLSGSLLLMGMLPILLLGQTHKLKFGKIDEADLTLTECSFDPEAEAMVLGETSQLRFVYNSSGFQYVYDYHVRIKVFNSDGYDYANGEVVVYQSPSGGRERLGSVRGMTYNLVDGKVEKVKMDKSAIYDEELSERYFATRFSLPKVQDGSVIEYSYSISSDFLSTLRNWEYQGSIPVRWSDASYLLPEWFEYQTIFSGAVTPVVSEQEIQQLTFDGVRCQGNYYHYVAEQVPAIRQEPFMTAVDDYSSRIRFQLMATNLPGRGRDVMMGSYANFNQTLLESERVGKFLQYDNSLPSGLVSSLQGVEDPMDRAVTAFESVKKKLRWNEVYSTGAGRRAGKIWDSEEGSVGDINLFLTKLYQEIGFEAVPVLLSTRSHGKPHPIFPSFDYFNYVVAAVKVDGQWHFADATYSSLPFGLLPPKALNGEGWAVAKQGKWMPLASGAHASQTIKVGVKFDESGVAHAKMSVHEEGYPAFSTRSLLSTDEKQAELISEIESYSGQWAIDSMTWENEDDYYAALEGTIHLACQESMKGDLIYLSPVLGGLIKENPFDKEVRSFPVDMPYGESQNYLLTMILPEGYEVEELPEQGVIRLPGDAAEFRYSVQSMGNMISISGKLDINKTFYIPSEYGALRQFYTIVAQRLSQPLVIKKTT
ncbi:MAG: DUF3857 domain-containing protein [Bacteroidota bacterium]